MLTTEPRPLLKQTVEFKVRDNWTAFVFAGGRTPLHCAASSNNIEAVRLLIEHGAGVLAFTWDTERETPLEKCSPDRPGFEECHQFIAGTRNAHRTDSY